MDGPLGVGEKANAAEPIPVQGRACLPEPTGIQTQNFAVSKYSQPQHTVEARGHLMVPMWWVAEVCVGNSKAGSW